MVEFEIREVSGGNMPGIFCLRAKERVVMGMSVKFTNENGEKYEIENIAHYDEIEVHEGCTVEVLRNSETGEVSIGWWHGTIKDKPIIDPMGLPC